MRRLGQLISYLLPKFLRKFFFQLFAISLGKGFDFGSVEKEFRFIKPFIGNDAKILIDIGANKGVYSEVLIKNYPNSNIYIFEPQKYLYDILLKKYSGQNNIKLFNIALDEIEKEALLIKGFDGDGEASIYQRKHLKNNKNLKEKILCRRLDQIILEDKIDFIKIDVEGNEMKVLRGMEKIMHNIKVLQIEFGGTWIDSRFFYRDLFEFLKERNFLLYRMAPNSLIELNKYEEIDEYFTFTNFIAVNKSIS